MNQGGIRKHLATGHGGHGTRSDGLGGSLDLESAHAVVRMLWVSVGGMAMFPGAEEDRDINVDDEQARDQRERLHSV